MKVYEDLISYIEEMINTGTSVMAPYPVNVVGRPVSFTKIKNVKKSKGEKRAPHTEVEIKEEYEKQNNHREHSPMHKFKYKKVGKIEKRRDMSLQEMMCEIAEVCEAIKSLDSKVEEANKISPRGPQSNIAYLYNKCN